MKLVKFIWTISFGALCDDDLQRQGVNKRMGKRDKAIPNREYDSFLTKNKTCLQYMNRIELS